MKKFLSVFVAVLVSTGLLVGTAQPAAAYTYKEEKVWSWVKQNAPVGARVIGKNDTIKSARLTCKVLNNGLDIYDVMDSIDEAAVDLTGEASDAYYEHAAATTVAAIHYLCPRFRWELDQL